MKKENFDDIEFMFKNDGVDVPPALSRESMEKKLRAVSAQKTAERKKRSHRAFGSLSAAAVLAIAALACFAVLRDGSVLTEHRAPQPESSVPQPEASVQAVKPAERDESLALFKSDDEVIMYLKKLAAKYRDTEGKYIYEDNASAMRPAAPGTNVYNGASDSAQKPQSSETNIQTEGVDEADIIKNDGRYLYIAHGGSQLYIVDSKTLETVWDGSIKPHGDGKNLYVSNLFLKGDKLVLIGTQQRLDGENGSLNETAVFVLDTSDKNDVKTISSFTQDGCTACSRMIGSTVYIVSQSYASCYWADADKTGSLPRAFGKNVSYDGMYVRREEKDPDTFTLVTAIDIENSSAEPQYACVLSRGQTVYCSQNRLYVTGGCDFENEVSKSLIYSFDLTPGGVKYRASAKIDGNVENQYAMDEWNGNLRVASTARNTKTWKNSCSVYILDGSLKPVGELCDIAGNEEIKSVRFMGGTAYVVTFRNTDPLFTLDLSDPKNPSVSGSVKLPGFSGYLHPLEGGMLLGVGYGGDDENVDFSTAKLTLFNVSDPKNPIVADSVELKNLESTVIKDPRAFVFDSRDQSFILPFHGQYVFPGGMKPASSEAAPRAGYEDNQFIRFAAENGKLVKKAVYKPDFEDMISILRGAFIGDKFYSVTDYTVSEFVLETGEKLRSERYSDSSADAYGYDNVIYNGMIK